MRVILGVSKRRRAGQSGNVVLESALIFLPLFAVGLAILDYGLALFIQNTLREAVREGVRFAITQQTGPKGQDAAIKSVVEYYSMGFLNDADIAANKSTFTIQYYDQNMSPTSSNAEGNLCVLTATIQHGWMAPLWRAAGLMTFSATSSDVMEAPLNGKAPTR